MSRELPPSKFGAGTTYGDTGQAHALPPTAPPSPPQTPRHPTAVAPPTYQAPADPYATAGYPAPPPLAAPQFSTSASYSSPVQPTVLPLPQPVGRRGASGAAIVAAILSLAGGVWYGIDLIRGWDAVKALLTSIDDVSQLGLSADDAAWAYGSVAAVLAQIIFVFLTALGGILLLARSGAGRTMVVLGSVLVIAANIFWAVMMFQVIDAIGANNANIAKVLLDISLPALLAIVALILAMSGSTKQWCQRFTGSAMPPTTY